MTDFQTLESLSAAWEAAKSQEKEAVEQRRLIEDEMASIMGLSPDLDGTASFDVGSCVIKVVGRLSHKVNSEVLDDIIRENGAEEVASQVFRFKPELNLRAWKQSDPEVQNLFFEAITTSAGRPSFAITMKEQQK